MVMAPLVRMGLVGLVLLKENALALMGTAPLAVPVPIELVPEVVSVPLALMMIAPLWPVVTMFLLEASVMPPPALVMMKAVAASRVEVSVPDIVIVPLASRNEIGLVKVV